MLLAIDIGNTNTVFAIFDGDNVQGEWRAATDPHRTADEYAVWLGQLLARRDMALSDVDAAIVSTVVPQGLYAICNLCETYCGCLPLVVGEDEVRLGIDVHVDRPQEVGADRLVNAVGAKGRFQGALIILDFGTATTFDAISEAGAYEGGVIAPGINLSLEALHQAAAQLPRIAVRKPDTVISRSTVPAMEAGIYWGYIGLIEGIVGRMKAEFGTPMTTVATGGLANLFADGTEAVDTVDADLTIRGLHSIYRLNRSAIA